MWHSFVWCDKLCSSAFGNYLLFFSSPLHLSSSVRLDGADAHFQVSPEIFDWVQAQALAGPIKDIHRVVYKPLFLCVCVGPLSCWKVNLLPSLRFWMLWTGFSLRLSQYFGALGFSSTLTFHSVPATEKQLHSMRLLPAHFTFGMVLCRWWAVPCFLQTECLELRFIRPENIISHSLRVL